MTLPESGDAGDQFLGKLLVGVDGSGGSRRAVEWTARLAATTGADVIAVHVLTYDRALLRDLTLDTIRTWRIELRRDLESGWTDPLRAASVVHRCLLVEDESPAAGLLAVAERERADLLVVGARGRGSLAGRVLGGVSYRLVHHADRPVVVVPRDRPHSDPT
jgi:nucleotide-binding universal stress UspA family protein